MEKTVYEFSAKTLKGEEITLDNYRGKVLLVVNTASKCGLTPQFTGLEEMYKKYKDKDFEILGFPCNQFANQEPGDADAISETCHINYGVSFPMFSKIDVNGSEAHPLYKYMKQQKKAFPTSAIKWNFTKFLIDREGRVVKRFAPNIEPAKIHSDVEKLL